VSGWEVPVTRVVGEGKTPVQAHRGDAGYDLYTTEQEPVTIEPGQFWRFDCKLEVQPPKGHWMMVVGRSSTFGTGLLVNIGVIDSGYRGALVVDCRNISREPIVVQPGDRLAQMIPIGLATDHISIERVDSLEPSERGTNGFGSTGK
jgi:dUTP pyrophosphatase